MENCTSLQNYWLISDRLQDYKSNENIPFLLLVYMNNNPLGGIWLIQNNHNTACWSFHRRKSTDIAEQEAPISDLVPVQNQGIKIA